MDFKPVICPYCGREMELDDRSFEGHGFWYSCDCGASSPFCKSEEEAYQYANPIVRQKWIGVEDKLPPVGTRVLACAGGRVVYEAYIDCNERWKRANSDHGFLFKITHWTHLPKPPEVKDQDA